ncbi:MAG: dihydrofolate reductase family protein [Lentisphaeria bacterium]|nr:dihydrofolate reductase family protein [Candidatus Neomarinimicrobiota bacterium]MCF7842842.1 dihydrofolate reductase family protein [Lentisphaeria bacterium]
MSRIIAAINVTLDGFCDHTAIHPDEEIHAHYAELLSRADAVLYGRMTYELMKFWQELIVNPSGEQSMDDFAVTIDNTPKIVFSHTLKTTGWDSAELSNQPLEQNVMTLRQQSGGDILVGSRSLIIQLMQQNLIDEYQLCVHPVIAGNGLPLFEKMNDHKILKLIKTKPFSGGAIVLYYEPAEGLFCRR